MITTNIHVDAEDVLTTNLSVQEHEYSGGPYPVLQIQLGSFGLTIYPGRDRAGEVADKLEALAAALRAASFDAVALRD